MCVCVDVCVRALFLQSHQNAWPFMEPVKKNDAPGYYQVIRFPMGMNDFISTPFSYIRPQWWMFLLHITRRFLSTATALLKLHAVQWFWSELIGLSNPSNLKLKMVSDIHVHVLSWELYTLHFTHAGMFKMVVFDLCCCFRWAEGFSNLTACLWHIFGMVSDRHYSFREMYKSGPWWAKEKSPEKTWARDLKSEPILFWATPRL